MNEPVPDVVAQFAMSTALAEIPRLLCVGVLERQRLSVKAPAVQKRPIATFALRRPTRLIAALANELPAVLAGKATGACATVLYLGVSERSRRTEQTIRATGRFTPVMEKQSTS